MDIIRGQESCRKLSVINLSPACRRWWKKLGIDSARHSLWGNSELGTVSPTSGELEGFKVGFIHSFILVSCASLLLVGGEYDTPRRQKCREFQVIISFQFVVLALSESGPE